MLNLSETYSRKSNILYDSKGNKILKFVDNTTDRKGISHDLVININNYIKTYPDRIEIINEVNQEPQLTLF